MRDWINLFESATLPPAFWQWFGASEVVDDHSDPLLVYHGGKPWRIAPGTTWFTDNPQIADGYADQGFSDPEIKACFLRIERPLDLRNEEVFRELFPTDDFSAHHGIETVLRYTRDYVEKAIAHAQTHGYDGVIHPDSGVANKYSHTSYVIFHPNQCKAARFAGWEHEAIYSTASRLDTGNSGAYSQDDDDLTK